MAVGTSGKIRRALSRPKAGEEVYVALDIEAGNEQGTDKDTLYLLGGLALMIFGAGLIIPTR